MCCMLLIKVDVQNTLGKALSTLSKACFTFVHMQVYIGDNLMVTVGVLRYELNITIVVVTVVVAVFIFIAVLVFFITCHVYMWFKKRATEREEAYRRRLSLEQAENKQLEREVHNMKSQVTMIHGQMKGN